MMTKRHFIQLADFIKAFHAVAPNGEFSHQQLEVLAAFCQIQNPKFNRERWLDYIAGDCSPGGGKV